MLTLEKLKEALPGVFDKATVPADTVAPGDVVGKALELWRVGNAPDASKHDFLFGLAMLRGGATLGRVKELLPLLPGGKQRRDGRDASYFDATVRSIDKVWKREEAALLRVRKMKSKDAFLPESLEALALVHEVNRAVYEKALRRMRKRLRVAKLEAEVKKELGKLKAQDMDGLARCVVDGKKIVGWWLNCNDEWTATRFNEFRAALDGAGLPSAGVCAGLTQKPWKLVNVPFGPVEEGRNWNKDSARLTVIPASGDHPTWTQILRVVGRGLDHTVKGSAWCQEHGVKTGGDYLLYWAASVVQRPMVPLPYLFFFGEQDCGKSLFHEALSLLMDPGYVVCNEALENKNGFNGELAGSILCAADEIELTKKAYKRIKLWTTSKWLLVHPKGASAYKVRNSCHFVQTGNSLTDCPLLEGDTRITVCEVTRATGTDVVPKDELETRCLAEAPAFLHTLLKIKLPAVVGRLGIPILETQDKKQQQKVNLTPLEDWCQKHPEAMAWDDDKLASQFLATLGGRLGHEWDKGRVLREVSGGVTGSWSRQRRVIRAILGVVSENPWRGTPSELLGEIVTLVGDVITTPEAMGQFLASPRPGLAVRRWRSKNTRKLEISLPG